MLKVLSKLGEICVTISVIVWLAAVTVALFSFTIGAAIWSTQWLISLIGG